MLILGQSINFGSKKNYLKVHFITIAILHKIYFKITQKDVKWILELFGFLTHGYFCILRSFWSFLVIFWQFWGSFWPINLRMAKMTAKWENDHGSENQMFLKINFTSFEVILYLILSKKQW